MQIVPSAIGCTTDHKPLAHCWNELPPIQLNSPSVAQAPVRPPAVEAVPDDAEDGAAAAGDDAASEGAAAAGDDAASEGTAPAGDDVASEGAAAAEVGATMGAEAAAPEAPFAEVPAAGETPPALAGVTADEASPAAGAEVAAGAAEPTADALPPLIPGQAVPVGRTTVVPSGELSNSRESPGLGNLRSMESTVSQTVVGMLATNISGAELRLDKLPTERLKIESSMESYSSSRLAVVLELDELLPAPATVMGAQFMYISRLPTLLNHVQASVYCPVARSLGIVNE